MLKRVVSILTALCFLLPTSGISAQDSHTPDIPKLMQAITDGDSDAMVSLGEAYYYGKGLEKNLELAAAWYRRAALAGNLDGMNWYGQVLAMGEGVKWDQREANAWFLKAANLGHAHSQALLAMGYTFGVGGTTQDYKLAAYWATEASKRKSQYGEYFLALLYYRGWGVERDLETAKLFASLAAQGKDDQKLASDANDLVKKISSDQEGTLIVGGLALAALLAILSSDSDKSSSQASSSNSSSNYSLTQDSAERNRLALEESRREYVRQLQQDYWKEQKKQYNRNLDCRQYSQMKDRYNERCP